MNELPSTRPAPAAAVRIAFLLVVAGALGCAPSEPEREPPLVPAIRILGTEFHTGGMPAVETRSHTTIDGVIRPTLSASRAFYFPPRCTPVESEPGSIECAAVLPMNVPVTPWAVIETTVPAEEGAAGSPKPGAGDAAGAPDTGGAGDAADAPDTAGADDGHGHGASAGDVQTIRTLVPGLTSGLPQDRTVRLPDSAIRLFRARPIPPLAKRKVVTPEITLPGGGELRTWIGVEEAAWEPYASPVVFTLSVVPSGEGKRQVIVRKLLDPAREPAHRGWIPVEIALPDLGETPFRLVFEARARNRADPRPSLPVWADPTIFVPEKEPRVPRRVVLVSLDTLRARSMSAFGYEFETTPRFEEMLREGTVFENAFTTFSNTLGSHMSMLTGLYPASHGVRAGTITLDDAIPTLADRMRNAGYETAAFTENALLRAAAGFQRGFARYFENKEIDTGAGDAEGTFGRALEWMREHVDQPVFVFVHTYEVHAPYDPPDDARQSLELPDLAARANGQRRDYEHEIVYLDRLLADFVADLGSLGQPEDLLLVITADHGEEFYEHGGTTHTQLYDEVMHVPMFLRWPGRVPAGVRIDDPVSLVDVVPTILDLAGAPPIPGDGASLVPLLEGAAIDRTVVFGQTARRPAENMMSRYVARSSDAKCMVRDDEGFVECFDLEADPDEKNPIAPDTSPELAALHEQAKAYRARSVGRAEETSPDEGLAAEDQADPERQRKLRLLGYIE